MECTRCYKSLKKRSTLPNTATKDGFKYFDYWQCPVCKVNYATPTPKGKTGNVPQPDDV